MILGILRFMLIACSCGVTFASVLASSAERTNQLLAECEGKQPVEMPSAGLLSCSRYIDGIIDMQAVMIGLGGDSPLFCLPKAGVPIDQAMKIFVEWVNEHPEDLHKAARITVVLALNAAYPCPWPKGGGD
jgi:hypothetical protein